MSFSVASALASRYGEGDIASFTGLLHVLPLQIQVPPIAFSPPETTSVPFSDPMFVLMPAVGGVPGARVHVIPFHSHASAVLLKPPSSMQAVAACRGGMPVASEPPPLLEPDRSFPSARTRSRASSAARTRPRASSGARTRPGAAAGLRSAVPACPGRAAACRPQDHDRNCEQRQDRERSVRRCGHHAPASILTRSIPRGHPRACWLVPWGSSRLRRGALTCRSTEALGPRSSRPPAPAHHGALSTRLAELVGTAPCRSTAPRRGARFAG